MAVRPLPPKIQIHLFENMVRPIVSCDNGISGVVVSVNTPIDKLLHFYIRCVRHVKVLTSNTIVMGEIKIW